MDISALTIIITSIVGLIAAFIGSGIWSLIAQRKITAAKVDTEEETAKRIEAETEKIRSEAAQIISNSSGELIVEYKAQVAELKLELARVKKQFTDEIKELKQELDDARIENSRLNRVIKDLNKRIVGLEH